MYFQDLLTLHNPSWKAFVDELERTGTKLRTNPDGDVQLEGVDFNTFVVPDCETCLAENVQNNVVSNRSSTATDDPGMKQRGCAQVKPDVIFFGESIPADVRDRSFEMVDECDRLLVVGTTLATYSAFRFNLLRLPKRSLH